MDPQHWKLMKSPHTLQNVLSMHMIIVTRKRPALLVDEQKMIQQIIS
jgi:hypothetical protein